MKKKLALAVAAVVIAASTVMNGSVTAQADVNVYTTEGTHTVNGREWRTTCEKYSQTKRCRTQIKATQVSEVNGISPLLVRCGRATRWEATAPPAPPWRGPPPTGAHGPPSATPPPPAPTGAAPTRSPG